MHQYDPGEEEKTKKYWRCLSISCSCGKRRASRVEEGDLVCFGTLLAELTEVSSSIQLGDQCRSFPKRQKKFPFPICEEEDREAALDDAELFYWLYILFLGIKLYQTGSPYHHCLLNLSDATAIWARTYTIYQHRESNIQTSKGRRLSSGELRRGLLTDIYLQNVILEEEGAKYQILPSCQKFSFQLCTKFWWYFAELFLDFYYPICQFWFWNVLRMCVLKGILKFLC